MAGAPATGHSALSVRRALVTHLRGHCLVTWGRAEGAHDLQSNLKSMGAQPRGCRPNDWRVGDLDLAPQDI